MGCGSMGDGLGCIHGYTQSYSKYFGQARVRTAQLVSLLGLPAMPC